MRLCLVTREFAPVSDYSGGIGTQYGALAPALARRGDEVHVLTPAPERASKPTASPGIELHLLPPPRGGMLDLVAWGGVIRDRLGGLGAFDAVVAPEWAGEAWRYARRPTHGSLVTHLHTSIAQVRRHRPHPTLVERLDPRAWLQHRLEQRQTESSAGLLACSRAVLASARELWRLDAIPARVVPNCIDVGRVRSAAAATQPPWLPREPVVFLSGRLEPRKGVHVLARAMRGLWDAGSRAELVLAGRDVGWRGRWMADHVREVAGPHAGRLRFLGTLPQDELFAALGLADVVALPSLWEAFGLAALEAMALGRPVVVTAGSGYEEFVTDGEDALTVPPGDAGELQRALGTLLEDGSLRRQLGAAGARTAERYTVGPVADAFTLALVEVLAAAEPAPAMA
jgi:glycogen synthase